jgi:hypothetical protein
MQFKLIICKCILVEAFILVIFYYEVMLIEYMTFKNKPISQIESERKKEEMFMI